MTNGNRNWGELQLEWAESGQSVKEFCARKGIPLPSGRRYLKQSVKDALLSAHAITECESDQQKSKKCAEQTAKSDHKETNPPVSLEQAAEIPNQSKKGRGGKREGAGAPKGNKNAEIHGLMTACFGDILKYADQANDQFKIKVFKAAQLKALERYSKYQEELANYKAELAEDGVKVSIEELEIMEVYESKMKSCFDQAVYYMSKEIQIIGQIANTEATNVARAKMLAQIDHIGVDTQLKSKGLALADAKTDQATTQAALNRYELSAKEKEGLGEKDDLGMELDEISEHSDDEINQRFKELEESRNES
ncbi:hypothetical protein [Vibrio harveyi]|uniref:hypothetical protein n=1 Tax=Vibrio harveyi TaxID=669 RepID=UPI0025B1E37C|nr:hypothetical protein [Vibrio harveyi]WJT09272.1 hypothetical protein PH545_24915 [Vibrio harveyi]